MKNDFNFIEMTAYFNKHLFKKSAAPKFSANNFLTCKIFQRLADLLKPQVNNKLILKINVSRRVERKKSILRIVSNFIKMMTHFYNYLFTK